MKKTILLTLIFFVAMIAHGQTWNGNISSSWDTDDNWTPSGAPSVGSNVLIPGGAPNFPKLSAAVTVNTLSMQTGSKIDLNGFAFNINTANGYSSVTGATISNSDATRDIIFNINTGTNGYNANFSQDTITDNIIFNITGDNAFFEGTTANKFLFNATFNLANTAPSYISYSSATLFSGNLSVNRTGAGNTSIFEGGGTVQGNFSYSNNLSGNSNIGNLSNTTNIAGTVNVGVNLLANNAFTLYRIKNQTTGGTISVKNTGGFDIRNDSLKLASLIVEDYKIPYAVLANNELTVTSQVKISDDPLFSNGYNTSLDGNTITGACNFFLNGTNNFFESNSSKNVFNGPVTFTALNAGGLFISPTSGSDYNGSLSVTRSIPGETSIFMGGGAKVTGNFNYSNNAGGLTTIGRQDIGSMITGTMSINANYASSGAFRMYRIINQTSGGNISINKAVGVDIRYDTLKLGSFALTNYLTGGYSYLLFNDITASTIGISDDPTFNGGYSTELTKNVFTANTTITINGTNVFYEANAANGGNIFTGSTIYSGNGAGQFQTSNVSPSTYNGNVSINRTVAGNSSYFLNGSIINGNLSYINNAGGNTTLGTTAAKTAISGTVNIAVNTPSQRIEILRLINQAAGGSVTLQNTGETNIYNDTLKVNSFIISGFSTAYLRVYNNLIDGNLAVSDDATNSGGYNSIMRGNRINGNTTYTLNGSNSMYEADVAPVNIYNGNVTYNRVGIGTFFVGNNSEGSEYGQNVTFNSSNGVNIARMKFAGGNNGTLLQQGTQVLAIPKIEMAKTGTGKLTLGSPISISDSLIFGGGNIESSATNPVNFLANSSLRGATATSHINGFVTKTGSTAFTFPIGTPTSIDSVSISAPSNPADRFSAQYFNADATVAGYDTAQRAAALKRVSGCEYWDVKREAGTSNVTLTLGFGAPCTTSGLYISTPSELRIAHWNGTSWEDLGNSAYTGTIAGTVTTAAPVSNFSPFSIASTDLLLNPLPLKLISFKGFRQGEKIKLQWQTENEIGLSRFELEKSLDGNRFELIGSFAANNSNGLHNYTGTDDAPFKGVNFYRLKQIDKDGSFTYSNIVKINFAGLATISISPNPVKDRIIISEAVAGDIANIYDMQGRLVKSFSIKGVNESLNVSNLTAGVYALQLVNNNSLQTVQFIK